MTRRICWILASVAAALALPAASAHAQRSSDAGVSVAVNPYVGAFVLDDSELKDALGREANIGPLYGGRLEVGLSRRWRIEGTYGFAPLQTEPSEFDINEPDQVKADLGVHLIYGGVDLLIGGDEEIPTRLLLSAGAGAILFEPDQGDGDAAFLLNFGAGFTHPFNPWITFRGDVKDHVAFCQGDPSHAVCITDEKLTDWEFSGGLEFWIR